MDGLSIPVHPGKVKRSAAAAILRRDWPELQRACVSTYFATAEFAVINEAGSSPAGYMLKAAISAEQFYQDTHSHRPIARAALDRAFASELWYHFRRSRKFQRPQAALWVALHNLVIERPEKIWKNADAWAAVKQA